MTLPNIPARLSFDSRGINNASAPFCPRLFTIAPGHTNDPQTQALGHAFAAVPALLEALEAMLEAYAPFHQHSVDHKGGEEGLHSAVRKARSALTAAQGFVLGELSK
jgi:hypothetical protein